ncbi:MAG: diphthamide biosynthesis enzyme Dph2 [Methanotrichaceae archaeon]
MDKALWTSGSNDHGTFNLDLEKAIDLIQKCEVQRVGIQVPEGLKRSALMISQEIEEKTGSEVMISGDPCYGACDIDLDLCQEVDLLIHIGHTEMLEGSLLLDKVIYLEARMNSDIREAVENAIKLLQSNRVGLVTTVQHVHKLEEAVKILKTHGIEGVLGAEEKKSRIRYRGQVLGCNYAAARSLDVDEYIFVGTGQFHPLGVALATGKRVVAADPLSCEASIIDFQPMLRRRYGAIARAVDAKNIAVLVSKKPGQKRWNLARKMMNLGKTHGREMSLVYVGNVEPDVLINLKVDAAVSTACPRIALDDAAKYNVPVLTPPEFEILLREREDYKLDEIEN